MSDFWMMGDFWIPGDFWIRGEFWIMGGEGQADRQTKRHRYQYHDSIWPRGRAKWKYMYTIEMAKTWKRLEQGYANPNSMLAKLVGFATKSAV